MVPFPNNLLLLGTTDLTLNIPVADPTNFGDPKVAMNALDGFSTTAPWSTTFNVPLDATTLVPGGTVRVFEVTLSGPGGGVTSIVRELASPQDFVVALAPSDTTGRTDRDRADASARRDDFVHGRADDRHPATAASRSAPACRISSPRARDSFASTATRSSVPALPDAEACQLEPLRLLTNSQEAAAARRRRRAGIDCAFVGRDDAIDDGRAARDRRGCRGLAAGDDASCADRPHAR